MSGTTEDARLLRGFKEREEALLRYGNGCRAFFIALTVLTVFAAAGVSIAALVVGEQAASINRFCVVAPDSPPGTLLGRVELQSNERSIEYEVQYRNLTAVIVALQVLGPIPAGGSTGPLAIELCGAISGAACDIVSEANKVKGKLLQAQPGSGSLRPVIRAIRKEPWRYYLSVVTGGVTPMEELRMPLTSLCGTAV